MQTYTHFILRKRIINILYLFISVFSLTLVYVLIPNGNYTYNSNISMIKPGVYYDNSNNNNAHDGELVQYSFSEENTDEIVLTPRFF